MATKTILAYTGSRLFEPLSISVGLTIDQLNFVISQGVAIIMAILYRKLLLQNDNISYKTRHLAGLIPGVILGYFCFGSQVSYLVVLITTSYIAMWTCNVKIVQHVVLFLVLLNLSYAHFLRVVNDYGEYTIDITGPMMIAVQKVSNFAFCLHDGLARPNDQLTAEQSRYAIRKRPSLLEFFSYVFQFHSLLAGPLVCYNDYIEFIEGTNFSRHLESSEIKRKQPTPWFAVAKKLFVSISFAVLLIVVAPKFPISHLADSTFLNKSSFITVMYYMFLATSVARFKYYHAWNLGESICNASGLGFNGFNEDGQPKWDLISSVDIFKFERSLNLRESLEAWNKTTQSWLRKTAYERARHYRTFATFSLSAFWHGFYPGYYLTFFTGALMTEAARSVRRCLRPKFQTSSSLAFFYDVVTFLMTRIMIAYLVFPFVLLDFTSSLRVYNRCFFFGHIVGLLAIFVLPRIYPPQRFKRKEGSDEPVKVFEAGTKTDNA